MVTKLNDKRDLILAYFDEILPNARCELNYSKDYEFLIAVMLSAQTNDAKVNKVDENLFKIYSSLNKLANAKIMDIERIIKPLGLSKVKSRNIISISNDLLNKYSGRVPEKKIDLLSLHGVGNKTANVVRIELFNAEEFPVDTHIRRIANRLGLTNTQDVGIIEKSLRKIFPKEKWSKLHHQFISFGRYYCKAINPQCENCKLKNICKYYSTNESKADK